jgi:putative DNA primase/helicase
MNASLDFSRLENVKEHGGKTTARCPVCAGAGGDKEGNHLVVMPDGKFGCIAFPGDAGSEHRKQIFAMSGESQAKPAQFQQPRKAGRIYATAKQAAKQCTPAGAQFEGLFLYPKSGKDFAAVYRFREPGKPKSFRQICFTGTGWKIGGPVGKWPLFRADVLRDGDVHIFEGELKTMAAASIGLNALSSAGGAGAALKSDWSPVAGRRVYIWPDRDGPGENYAATVASEVLKQGSLSVHLVRVPGEDGSGLDIADYLKDGAGMDDVDRLVQNAPAWIPATDDGATIPLTQTQTTEPDFPLTDYGNAERLVRDHGKNLKHCGSFGKWFSWDGKRWRDDETGEVIRCAKNSVRRIHAEADRIKPGDAPDEYSRKHLGDLRERIFRHALKSEESHEIKAQIELAQTENNIPVLPHELDRDPFALCVLNGVINLRTSNLKNHDRGDLITKLAPVAYDPDAKCPRWETFLSEIFGGEQDVISYIRRAVGYSLTADQREQVLFFLYGTGANGKSTFMNTVSRMIGDYSQRAPRSLILSDGNGDRIPADVARLKGARLVSCSELEEGRALAEATVKDLTGGDRIVARFMRQDFFEFEPTHKLWMLGNHRPMIRGTDHGVWRRIHLVPFMVTFGPDRRDPTLQDKLNSELPGILTWAIQGCQEWLAFGLTPPAVIRAAVAEYRNDEDRIGQFIDDACVITPKAWTASHTLYHAFRDWCEALGDRPFANKTFANRLRDRGFVPLKTGGERGWTGISLKSGSGRPVDGLDGSTPISPLISIGSFS